MKTALLQLNFIVGDLEGNGAKIRSAVQRAMKQGADLCITSELALLGYPPRDLLLYDDFIEKASRRLQVLSEELSDGPAVIVGTADRNCTGRGKPLFNAAVLLEKGKITASCHKSLLPTYDVFDEDRYFERSDSATVVSIKGVQVGVTICEDIWNDKTFWSQQRYGSDPVEKLVVAQKLDCLVNLSGSPFTMGKQEFRERMLQTVAKRYRIPVLYVNQVGGNDDLVFDGRTSAFDGQGRLLAGAKPFVEDILVVDMSSSSNRISEDDLTAEADAWQALVLGTRDYVQKCGFRKAVLGLSGGVDSALTAAIAVEALGKQNVLGVLMPSPYSSKGSIDDALTLASILGIKTKTIPIESLMKAFDEALAEPFKGYKPDVTEENIQARIRGNILMALSNKYGAVLLSTGNKSELSVGYCTIYGDMSGGLAAISDVPKMMVYRIARWLNSRRGTIIPEAVLNKAPSAELRPNQTDQDSLPPYDILDEILEKYVVLHKSQEQLFFDGMGRAEVDKVIRMFNAAEFKRKQAPPGLKITDRAFGAGWRMPIARKLSG